MPRLIRFMLANLLVGGLLGAGVAMAVLGRGPVGFAEVFAASGERWLAGVLTVYFLGSTFAIGFLATALATFSPDE